MGLILWLVIGGVVGWLASIVMKRDGSQGIFLNIVVGIVGAMLGGWLIGPMVGAPSINSGQLSVPSLLVSFLGAVILLAIVAATVSRRFSRGPTTSPTGRLRRVCRLTGWADNPLRASAGMRRMPTAKSKARGFPGGSNGSMWLPRTRHVATPAGIRRGASESSGGTRVLRRARCRAPAHRQRTPTACATCMASSGNGRMTIPHCWSRATTVTKAIPIVPSSAGRVLSRSTIARTTPY